MRKRLIITAAAIAVGAVSALADQQRLRNDVRVCLVGRKHMNALWLA